MSAFVQHSLVLLRRCAGGLLAGLALTASAQGQPAGKLIMAIGSVSLAREGKDMPAVRETAVLVGDTVRTGASSNAQLRLNDGAIIALRPNSEFKVNAFQYNGKTDGSENASLSLLKGGVRAVTGAIGRTNRDNLKVDAVVATIGIRGTGFNVVLCDAACKTVDPESKNGLYAGVFEGRIAVANESGTTVELGVNQFLHVADAQSRPSRLLGPPAVLLDRLEGQRQVKQTALRVAGVTGDAAARQVVEKAPTEAALSTGAGVVTANKVSNVVLAPPSNPIVVPTRFFDQPVQGDAQMLLTGAARPANTWLSFQSAEFNPAGEQRRADNQVLENVNDTRSLVLTPYDGYKLQTVVKNDSTAYAIRDAYTATQKEGGADGGVLAWGRWAGGTAFIGNYGTVSYTDNQGFHWLAGARLYEVPVEIQNKSYDFNLIGATVPTEARAGAQAGWRVYGGNLKADFGAANVAVSGLLNLYAAQANGSGTFDMRFSGASDANSIAFTRVTASVLRTQGDLPLCVVNCGGAGVVAFFGSQASHAGLTYEFNTGATYVQGAAAFRR